MHPLPSRRVGGFTLLEVLVAFVIAAMAIGVMIEGVVGGLRAASTAAHTQQAVALARSRLAAAAASILDGPPPQAEQSGDDGAFHWEVRTAPTESAQVPRQEGATLPGINVPTPTVTLYAIRVVVGWTLDGGHRQVRLDGAQTRLTPPAGAAS